VSRTLRSSLFAVLFLLVGAPFARAQEGPAAPAPAPPEDGTLPAEPDEPSPSPSPPPYDSYAPGPVMPTDTAVAAEAEPRPLRKGFFGGGAFGLGVVKTSCDTGQGCGEFSGVGFSLDAGWAFSPKWAVVGELWFTGGVSDNNSDEGGQLLSWGINARYWVADRFWLQAGLAATSFDLLRTGVSGPVASAGGSGLVLGAGVDLWRSSTGHIVIDLRARLGFLSVKDDSVGDGASGNSVGTRQTTAMVGVSWY
jgi:hypothetical protein